MNYKVTQSTQESIRLSEAEGTETARDFINYISIPAWILDYPIRRNSMLLYGVLNSFNVNDKPIFASNEFLGETLHIASRSVGKLLNELEKHELIVCTYKDDSKKHRKSITVINPIYEARQADANRYVKQRIQIRQTAYLDTSNDVHTNKHTNKHKYIRSFEEFWSVYPKKIAKKSAQAKYISTLKGEGEIAAAEIQSGLERWLKKWKADKTELQYIPHATTWINQERWKDEFESKSPVKFRKL